MSQFADWFAPSLLRASLLLVVAALLVATCVRLLKLRSPAGEQWAWLLVLVQGVMFAWLTVPVSSGWLPRPLQSSALAESFTPVALPALPQVAEPIPARPDAPRSLEDAPANPVERPLIAEEPVAIANASPPNPAWRDRWPSLRVAGCCAWLVGLVTVIGVAAQRYVGFVRRMRHAIAAPADWSAEWQQLCRDCGVQASIPLVVAANIGPALCRLPSGHRLVVPESIWRRLSVVERSAILRHELEHFRRGDLWRLLVVRLLASVHWFNPLAWWAARQYEAQSEYACDAIAAGDDPAMFSELLIQMAGGQQRRIAGVQAVAGIGVYDRVQRLLCVQRPHPSWRSSLPIMTAAAALVIAGVRVEAVMHEAGEGTEQSLSSDRPVTADREPGADAPQPEPATKNSGETPGLDELMQAFALHERAYLKHHFKSMHTFVVNDGLTDQERSGYPWADGRKHQRAMEHGQLAPGTWFAKETILVDGVVESSHLQLPDPDRPHTKYDWPWPITAVYPLFGAPERMMLSEAVRQEGTSSTIEADGDVVKLTVVTGSEPRRRRVIVWLSRAHAWHPVRYQRYIGKADALLSEWEASRLELQNGQWRVVAGRIQWFDLGSPASDPKKTYSIEFDVTEATYGEAVDPRLFTYGVRSQAKAPEGDGREPAPELTRDVVVSVVNVQGDPVAGATVTSQTRGLTALQRDLVSATTDERGVATVRAPDGDFGMKVSKEGSRDAGWIQGGPVTETRAILAPITVGRTVDENGTVLKDVWVSSSDDVRFRADGLIYDPRHSHARMQRSVWSDESGAFELKSEQTLRRTSDSVLISAIDAEQARMALVLVPAARLAEPLTLTMLPVCKVEGSCLLEGIKDPTDVRLSIEDDQGRELASAASATSVVEQGLRVAFRFRLPPGEYRLQSRRTSRHAAISIPVRVPAGEHELHLEQQLISPSGLQTLIGKPAPELAGTWPADDGITLKQLRGNVVVLDFWGYWCLPCLTEMPLLMDMAEEFKDRPVKWLAIHDPYNETGKPFDERLANITRDRWKGRKLSIPLLIDASAGNDQPTGVTGQRYSVYEWPTLILIDRNGNVAGAATHDNLREKIEALLR